MDESKVSLFQQIKSLCIAGLIFGIVYHLAAWYACGLDSVPSLVLPLEQNIPFIPWMILPYMSSGLFFIGIFFLVKQQNELDLLLKRMVFITLVSGLCFVLFPLKFSFNKPPVSSKFLHIFFEYLNTYDTNFNQAPSLHISYGCLFWSIITTKLQTWYRSLVGIWLLLMGISTLVVYQHHLIDVFTALILVCITFWVYPKGIVPNYRLAMLYFLFSSLIGLLAMVCWIENPILSIFLIYLLINLLKVGRAYLHTDAHFLKQQDGTILFINKIVFFPYLLTYKLMRTFFCRNIEFKEVYNNLWIGPFPDCNMHKQIDLYKESILIDLSAELEESKILRSKTNYYFFPMLDIASTKEEDLNVIITTIVRLYENLKPHQQIFIHCTMGYSRSVMLASKFLEHHLQIDRYKSFELIKKKYPNALYLYK